MIDEWKAILMQPEETVKAAKAKASLGKGIVNFVIAGIILGLLMAIGFSTIGLLASPLTGLGTIANLGIAAFIILPILMLVLVLIGSLIINLCFWIAARLVKGNGSFSAQYHMLSLPVVPLLVAYLVALTIFVVLCLIPIIGPVIGLLVLYFIMGYVSIMVYMAYVSAMKEIHGFTTKQVGLATGVGLVITLVVAIIIVAILALAFSPIALSMLGTTGLPSGFLPMA